MKSVLALTEVIRAMISDYSLKEEKYWFGTNKVAHQNL
jgi:hypothetical protein